MIAFLFWRLPHLPVIAPGILITSLKQVIFVSCQKQYIIHSRCNGGQQNNRKTTYGKTGHQQRKKIPFIHLGPISKCGSQIHITRIIKSNKFFLTDEEKKKLRGRRLRLKLRTGWQTECFSPRSRVVCSDRRVCLRAHRSTHSLATV